MPVICSLHVVTKFCHLYLTGMVSRRFAVWVLASGLLLLSVFILVKISNANAAAVVDQIRQQLSVRSDQDLAGNAETVVALQQMQKQRDELSLSMRQLSKEYHQYQCEVGASKNISSNGGWCIGGKHHVTDQKLAGALTEFFEGFTVASFGDGDGGYKKLMDKSGKVPVYDSYDGAPFCENKTGGLVKFLDLSMPVFGLKLYDWIISLEVGEHIPQKYEQTFLDNIARHAGKGIILSWAPPKQGGHGHVNCQPFEYIVDQLEKRGFDLDKESSAKLQAACKVGWLKRNTNVYRRKSSHTANQLMI